jgi:spore coat protein CotH
VPDGKFLKSRFPDDDDGNLYDGKYKYDENTGNYTMVDFATGVDDLFQLEEGVDNGHADVSLVSETIFASRGEGFDEALDPLVDWGEVHTNWAAEQWVGHVDGYAMNRNNYRVYFRPSDGRMMIVPWDFDYAFIEDSSWGMSWRSPNGKLAKGCWTDGSCAAAQVEAMQALTGTSEGEGAVNTDSLLEYYDAMAALIEDEAMDDPKRECSARNVRDYQSSVRSWIQTRSGSMRSYWGI